MGFDIDLHDPDGVFKPGTTALVCWNYKYNSEHRGHDCYDDGNYTDDDYDYWIGVICGVGTMPAEVWQKRQPGAVVPRENWEVEPEMTAEKQYPVFLPTKGELYWLPRSAIGYLGMQEKNIYQQRQFDFKKLYEMAIDTKRYSREYWLGLAKDAIREDNVQKAHRRMARGAKRSSLQISTQDQASGEEEQQNASQVKESENEQRPIKRARTSDSSSSHLKSSTTVQVRPLQSLAGITARSSTAATMKPSDDSGVKIKQEGMEDARHQVITVYIGRQNQVFKISQDDLLQSPVLSGYIRGRSFIMDPDLMEIDSVLFEAVSKFLKTAEFQPRYVAKGGGDDLEPGAGSLEGINGHKAYTVQLLRLGKLYILAWKFNIPRMMLLIRQKIVAGVPKGSRSNQAMLNVIDQIFRDMPGLVENAAADQSEGPNRNDLLKEWLITWLAENMRACTYFATGSYWNTLDTGVGLSLAVHRAKIQIIEKHKGELVKIEDNEVSST